MTAASPSPRPDHQRVVVTGLGAITNLGRDVPTIWSALQSGRSGIDTIQCFDQAESVWSCKVAGEVRDWTPNPVVDDKAARRMDRYCQLAMWAADEAVKDSGYDFTSGDPYRHGVVVGSGVAGISTIEQGIEKPSKLDISNCRSESLIKIAVCFFYFQRFGFLVSWMLRQR